MTPVMDTHIAQQLNEFLEDIAKDGFCLGLKFGPGGESTFLTYTVYAPSGKPYGRGYKTTSGKEYLHSIIVCIDVLLDSARKTVEMIKRDHPDELIQSEKMEMFSK